MTPMFLNPDDLAELTGVKVGRDGKTRGQRQAAALKAMRIPFYLNVAGRVIVARAMLEGGIVQPAEPTTWESARA
jgi:hypothetical protein